MSDVMTPEAVSVTPDSEAERERKLETNKLQKRLRREAGQAIQDFRMIESGDRVMVCAFPEARIPIPCWIS